MYIFVKTNFYTMAVIYTLNQRRKRLNYKEEKNGNNPLCRGRRNSLSPGFNKINDCNSAKHC